MFRTMFLIYMGELSARYSVTHFLICRLLLLKAGVAWDGW